MNKTGQRTLPERKLPSIGVEKCTGCGACARVCYRKAISFGENDKASIFRQRCAGMENCGRCVTACDHEAISTP